MSEAEKWVWFLLWKFMLLKEVFADFFFLEAMQLEEDLSRLIQVILLQLYA